MRKQITIATCDHCGLELRTPPVLEIDLSPESMVSFQFMDKLVYLESSIDFCNPECFHKWLDKSLRGTTSCRLGPLTSFTVVTKLKLTLEEITKADDSCSGFCIECHEEQCGVEPDARKYLCESCGCRTVYGAAQLVLENLVEITGGNEEDD